MTEYAIRLAKPHCESCHKPKNRPDGILTPQEAHAEEITNGLSDTPLTLAERLTHVIQSAKQREEDDSEAEGDI